jgi:hypothetical protein
MILLSQVLAAKAENGLDITVSCGRVGFVPELQDSTKGVSILEGVYV